MLFKYEYTILKEPRKLSNKDNDTLLNSAARAMLESEKRLTIKEKVNLRISDISSHISKRKNYIDDSKIIKEICNKIASKYYEEQWREPILTYYEDDSYKFHFNLPFDGQFSILNKEDEYEIEFTGDIIMNLMKSKQEWMKKSGWNKIGK